MKVLIIDDSIAARKVVLRALHALGIKRVYEAQNGREALHILHKNPDVNMAVVDWEMPQMDGLEFIKSVREDKAYQGLKLVMASARSSKEDVITALKAGADNYIAKPFSDQSLKTHLKPVIDSLKPAKSTEEFISYFSKKQVRDVVIKEETMHLDFGDKKIAIDIPLMIYHGAIQIEEEAAEEENFVPLKEE